MPADRLVIVESSIDDGRCASAVPARSFARSAFSRARNFSCLVSCLPRGDTTVRAVTR
jgi:hypothetical protein